MAINKLSTKFCDFAPAGMHFDGEGLCLLVKPNGKRYWQFFTRMNGKKKVISLGPYPKTSLEKARKAHKEAQELLDQGIDPTQNKKEKKAAQLQQHQETAKTEGITFEQVARKLHISKEGKTTDEHRDRMLRQLEIHVFQHIGHKHIAEIGGAELLELFQGVSKKTNHGRPMTYMALRLCQWCGEVFDFAHVLDQKILNNPCHVVLKHLPKHTEQHMARICAEQLPGFVRDLLKYKGHPLTKAALWTMLYTGMRTVSVRRALLGDILLEKGIWNRRPEKLDKNILITPLPRQAIKVIKDILPLTGGRPEDLAFPSIRTPFHPMSEAAICQAIKRIGYDMVGHGVRGLVSTCLNDMKFAPHLVEAQLGHKKDKVEAAYNSSTYFEERCKMMQKWADFLDTLIKKAAQ